MDWLFAADFENGVGLPSVVRIDLTVPGASFKSERKNVRGFLNLTE
jgi:hypothetical protein